MPQEGDRVIVAGTKLGAPRREGTLVSRVGSMIRVRWQDGSESLFTPGAGSVEFQPAGRRPGPAAVGRAKGRPNGAAGEPSQTRASKPARKATSSTKAGRGAKATKPKTRGAKASKKK